VEVAKQAIEAAEAAEDLAIAARAHLVLSEALGQIDPSHTYALTHQDAAAALGTLQRAGDDAGIVQATLTLAVLLFHEGRCAESVEMMSRLLDRAPDLPSSDRRRIALALASGAHHGPFSAEEGLRAHTTASSLVKDSIITQAQLDNMQTVFLAMEGKAEESRAKGERAEHRWLDIGMPALSAYADEGRGEAERYLGRPDLAAEYFGRCIEIWDSFGRDLLQLHDDGPAGVGALRRRALRRRRTVRPAEPGTLRRRRLRFPGGDADGSSADPLSPRQPRRRARDGRRSDRDHRVDGLPAFVAESHEIRAVVLLADGRVDEARAEFEQAAELYERKGIVPWARRVRHVLEGLGHPSP